MPTCILYIFTYIFTYICVCETTLKSCMSFYHWVPLGWQEHFPNLGPGVILILHNYEWCSANNAAHQTSLHLSWALPDPALEEQSLGWCDKQVQLFFSFTCSKLPFRKVQQFYSHLCGLHVFISLTPHWHWLLIFQEMKICQLNRLRAAFHYSSCS